MKHHMLIYALHIDMPEKPDTPILSVPMRKKLIEASLQQNLPDQGLFLKIHFCSFFSICLVRIIGFSIVFESV